MRVCASVFDFVCRLPTQLRYVCVAMLAQEPRVSFGSLSAHTDGAFWDSILLHSSLFCYILFYSIVFYSSLFFFILFSSILS